MKKTIVIALIVVLLICAVGGTVAYFATRSTPRVRAFSLQHFATEDDFMEAFKNGLAQYSFSEEKLSFSPTSAGDAAGGTPEHSTTNVQVEGVDEADIVKNDGNHIYAISGNRVFIVKAYPAKSARVVSRIDFNEAASLNELFLVEDSLVVIGSGSNSAIPEPGIGEEHPYPRGGSTFMEVYDVSNKEKPARVRAVEYEGDYSTARMIDDDIHVVLTTYPYYAYDRKGLEPDDVIPMYREDRQGGNPADFEPACDFREVEVVDPRGFTSFLSIVSFSVDGVDPGLSKKVIAGYSDTVYASLGNIYVASAEWPYYGGWRMPEPDSEARTTIHRFALEGPRTRYVASGQVPGTILNQFSMDESNGFFRIATTRGHLSREGSDTTNNVYILDPDMKIAGRLEGLAAGESIYSVRFMGARAYMVTFKKVDPLFVLDLADPLNPRVLGELKIPGYSDYLHPYDETHVIGVGKNTVEAAPEEGGNFAWYQGMKIAIFDVTDVANPTEMHKVEIGDRGTDSYALYDHKAFLFDREKNLLVVPVLLAELTPEQKASPERKDYDYGEYTFQGAYVYDISLEGGFKLKGRVTHAVDPAGTEYEYGYYGAPESVRRALYIDNDLYTVSEARIKINALDDLAEIKTVELK
jgi:uncharacterized secreted protein with C-terminal beta-propeller domain